jgi:hypothetical protein
LAEKTDELEVLKKIKKRESSFGKVYNYIINFYNFIQAKVIEKTLLFERIF